MYLLTHFLTCFVPCLFSCLFGSCQCHEGNHAAGVDTDADSKDSDTVIMEHIPGKDLKSKTDGRDCSALHSFVCYHELYNDNDNDDDDVYGSINTGHHHHHHHHDDDATATATTTTSSSASARTSSSSSWQQRYEPSSHYYYGDGDGDGDDDDKRQQNDKCSSNGINNRSALLPAVSPATFFNTLTNPFINTSTNPWSYPGPEVGKVGYNLSDDDRNSVLQALLHHTTNGENDEDGFPLLPHGAINSVSKTPIHGRLVGRKSVSKIWKSAKDHFMRTGHISVTRQPRKDHTVSNGSIHCCP